MLRTGRALFNFEDTIKYTPTYVLERSMYLNQIREFMEHIPRERIFFFILEDFLADKERTIRKMAEFLSLRYDDFPEGALDTHANRASFPKSIKLQVLKNRILRTFGNMSYEDRLPFSVENIARRRSFFARFVNIIHGLVNPSKPRPTPKMDIATKNFLDKFFQKELEGIENLVGADLNDLWFERNR